MKKVFVFELDSSWGTLTEEELVRIRAEILKELKQGCVIVPSGVTCKYFESEDELTDLELGDVLIVPGGEKL